jgi:LytS/YehU family sensor histidine kinase
MVLTILIISIIGMAELKQQLEVEKLLRYEVYFWTFAVLFWSTLIGVILTQVFDRWASYKQLKNEHAKAELSLLKSKVDPHFFFNTLNNLYGLTVEKSEKAPDVILKLSDIMRYVIYEGDEERVQLKKEIEYLEKYIEIHKIRFQKKVDITFDKQVENDLVHIAPLLLVTLVENAFKHGVEQLSDNAFLKIGLRAREKELEFTVKNNFKEKDKKAKSGIGLKNLRKRLHFIYPEKHELVLEKKDSVFTAVLKLRLR